MLLAAVLAIGVQGIGRSLWLDEVWVANSVRQPTWSGMFFYPNWLQTTPPLFLTLARESTAVFGMSVVSLRLVPLALALVAVGATLALAWRIAAPSLALLAVTLLAFHPTAIDYWRSFKQYGGEAAAAAVLLLASVRYLKDSSRANYAWLVATAAITSLLAYPVAFLVPGVGLAVYLSGARRRAVMLAVFACAWFLAIYVIFVRPNLAPELRIYWAQQEDPGIRAWLLVMLPFAVFATARASLSIYRGTAAWRQWTALVCALPCLLLAASSIAGLYPVIPRTRLFVLPGLLVLAALTAEDFLGKLNANGWSRRIVNTVAGVLCIGLGIQAMRSQFQASPAQAQPEDLAAAVRFLEQHVGPHDLVLVHASVREGFLFYSALDGWKSPPAVFGDTGWPCCARGRDARPGSSSTHAVLEDLKAKIPNQPAGRIWLFYTARPTHWNYTGLDEANLWRKTIWESGCPAVSNFDFHAVEVTPMQCSAAP